MSSDTCLFSFGARLFVLADRFPWFPGLLRCVAQNPRDSIDDEFHSENSLQLRLCFFFQPSVLFSHRDPMYSTLSFNRVQVQTLPTEKAAPVLTDSFSHRYDPYTDACKARPLTTVGRTSLSVIIIIILPKVPFLFILSGGFLVEFRWSF